MCLLILCLMYSLFKLGKVFVMLFAWMLTTYEERTLSKLGMLLKITRIKCILMSTVITL